VRLSNKVIVITGASRGMGLGLSDVFAAEGAIVVMLARSAHELNEAASTIKNALPIVCDISDPDDVRSAFKEIEIKVGGVDVLINNAAVSNPQLVEEADDGLAQLEVAVNILGPFYCIREAVRMMRQRGGGDIINVTSESVRNPYPYLALYAATKSALETLSIALRGELKGSNIRVVVYRSGRVKGTLSRNWDPEMAIRARAAAQDAGYYAFSGDPISAEVAGNAMVDLVLLDRSAHIDFLELRAA